MFGSDKNLPKWDEAEDRAKLESELELALEEKGTNVRDIKRKLKK